MKKLIFSALLLIGLTLGGHAQHTQHFSKNAIGLRVGTNDGFGAEFSYQRGISPDNRLEFDLGLRSHAYYHRGDYYDTEAVKLVALYQWVWHINQGFNWYAGVGAGLGSYRDRVDHGKYYYYDDARYHDSGAFGLIAGDIGIEYDFDFPLQLSFDFRPELGFGDYRYTNEGLSTFGPDVAIGARFRF